VKEMEKIEEENRKLKEAIYKVNSLGLYSQNYWLSQLAYAIERGNLDDFLKDIEEPVERSQACRRAAIENYELCEEIEKRGFKRLSNNKAIVYCEYYTQRSPYGFSIYQLKLFAVKIKKSDIVMRQLRPSQVRAFVKGRVGFSKGHCISTEQLLELLSINEIRNAIFKAFPDKKEEIKNIIVTKLATERKKGD